MSWLPKYVNFSYFLYISRGGHIYIIIYNIYRIPGVRNGHKLRGRGDKLSQYRTWYGVCDNLSLRCLKYFYVYDMNIHACAACMCASSVMCKCILLIHESSPHVTVITHYCTACIIVFNLRDFSIDNSISGVENRISYN